MVHRIRAMKRRHPMYSALLVSFLFYTDRSVSKRVQLEPPVPKTEGPCLGVEMLDSCAES